jgi:hypothetical protein
MQVTCPACGKRQDDFGRTSFTCSGCGKSLSTVAAESHDSGTSWGAPFGWAAKVWLGSGVVTHVVGVIVLVASLIHHDPAGDRAPSFAGTVTGSVVAWLGFLFLLVGLAAYGVEVVTTRMSTSRPSTVSSPGL